MKPSVLARLVPLGWLSRWCRPDIEFVTLLPLDECQRRLAKALARERSFLWPATKDLVLGEINGEHFRMYKKTLIRVDFWPVLSGQLRAVPEGTFVQASFRGNKIVVTILRVVGSGFGLLWLCDLISKLLSGLTLDWEALVIYALCYAFLILFMVFTPQLGNASHRYVIQYLCRTLLKPHIDI